MQRANTLNAADFTSSSSAVADMMVFEVPLENAQKFTLSSDPNFYRPAGNEWLNQMSDKSFELEFTRQALRANRWTGPAMSSSQHVYEVRPRKDHHGVDLISDALPFGRLWYAKPDAPSNAIGYAKHRSRSHRAVIRVYGEAGNVIETHEHAGQFKEP
jgi:hypothetical protein